MHLMGEGPGAILSFKTFLSFINRLLPLLLSLQSCPTLCDPHRRQPTRLPRPWDSPGKNTAVGCHVLLQCRKVKSESEVAQSCLTLSNPMDCSLPGSSIHEIFQARVQEWGAIAFSGQNLGLVKIKVQRILIKVWSKREFLSIYSYLFISLNILNPLLEIVLLPPSST